MLMKTKEKFAVMLVDGQVKYILGTQGLQFPPQYTRGTPMADPAASLSHCHTVTVSCHTTDNCKLSRSRVTQNTAPLPATGHPPGQQPPGPWLFLRTQTRIYYFTIPHILVYKDPALNILQCQKLGC